MPPTSMEPTTRAVLGVAAGVLLMAACLPVAQRIDEHTDRTRPMYEDRRSMEWLQYRSVTDTGGAVPLQVSGGESVSIAGEVFTPSDGVTVVVRTTGSDPYCVQVSNQHGDVSDWACLDEEEPPIDPGAPPDPGL